MEKRRKELQELEEFLVNARSQVDRILETIGWNVANTLVESTGTCLKPKENLTSVKESEAVQDANEQLESSLVSTSNQAKEKNQDYFQSTSQDGIDFNLEAGKLQTQKSGHFTYKELLRSLIDLQMKLITPVKDKHKSSKICSIKSTDVNQVRRSEKETISSSKTKRSLSSERRKHRNKSPKTHRRNRKHRYSHDRYKKSKKHKHK